MTRAPSTPTAADDGRLASAAPDAPAVGGPAATDDRLAGDGPAGGEVAAVGKQVGAAPVAPDAPASGAPVVDDAPAAVDGQAVGKQVGDTLAEERRPIRARATRFDLSATPLHWVPGDAQTTHTMNVLHLLLPPGERWFCDVYRDALPLITDERLRADARGFLNQEATHAKAHDGGLEHLAAHGIDLRREVARADRVRMAGRKLIRVLPPGLRRRVLTAELAAIAAIEHFTAVLGVWIVEDSAPLDDLAVDPAMLDLLRWHGAEEVEHRSVAFDIFDHLGGTYGRRVVAMYLAVGALIGAWIAATQVLWRLDPETRGRPHWREFTRAADEGRLPTFRSIMDSVPDYLRRDHHPSQVGDTQLALDYLASSPGVVHRRPR